MINCFEFTKYYYWFQKTLLLTKTICYRLDLSSTRFVNNEFSNLRLYLLRNMYIRIWDLRHSPNFDYSYSCNLKTSIFMMLQHIGDIVILMTKLVLSTFKIIPLFVINIDFVIFEPTLNRCHWMFANENQFRLILLHLEISSQLQSRVHHWMRPHSGAISNFKGYS